MSFSKGGGEDDLECINFGGGGDGDWGSRSSWDGGWSDSSAGVPQKVSPQALASFGTGAAVLGHMGGQPSAMVNLGGGQAAVLEPLLPAQYVGLSRAEMGELVDSLTRTHSNLIALAEMCQRNKNAYEAEASGIQATIHKLNKFLR